MNESLQESTMKSNLAKRAALICFAALLPALVTFLFVGLLIQRPLQAYMPNSWNDAVSYWHYIESFSTVGFSTGYYTLNETPALLSAIHYDVHGPTFQMLYGSLAHFFGWQPYSAIFYNIVIVGLGIVLFSQLAALNIRQVALLCALVSVYWLFPLYLVPPNQEPVHLTAALVFAGVFGRLLFISRRIPWWGHVLFGIFLLYISVMRFAWSLLIIPYLILISTHTGKWVIVRAVVLGGLFIGLIIGIFRYVAAPGLNPIVGMIDILARSVWEALQTIGLRFMVDFSLTFGIGAPEGMRFGNWQACLYIALLVILLVIGRRARRLARAHNTAGEKARVVMREVSFHWYHLGSMLLLSWLLYIPAGYERVLGAQLLLSLALLIVAQRERLVLGLVIAFALGLPLAIHDFVHDQTPNFNVDTTQFEATRVIFARNITYQADVASPWCNTVLLRLAHYDWHVIAIPVGIGVSYVQDFSDLPQPLRSRYVLALEQELEQFRQNDLHLTLLDKVPDGLGLYVNENATCSGVLPS